MRSPDGIINRGSKTTRFRRTAVRLASILAVLYMGWCALLFGLQEKMIFVGAGPALLAAKPPADAESIWVGGDSASRVEGWLFMPKSGRDQPTPVPLVVFTHGNAERIDDCRDIALDYRARGFAVLLPEYCGYGRSGGKPGERAIVSSVAAMIEAAAARPGVDGRRVILHGRSLGGAVAALVAARMTTNSAANPAALKPAALIMQSTFTSVADMAKGMCIPAFCIRHPLRTDRAVAMLECPVLILHGADDEIVPVQHGRKLHAAAPGSVYAELQGHHNDFPVEPLDYWREIDSFLADAALTPPR